MASLFTPPYFDVGAGITPADGALLNFYVVGSGTRKNTFPTAAATPGTEHENPVEADALGVFPAIYLVGDYDWVLTDKGVIQKNTGSVSEFVTSTELTADLLLSSVKPFETLALAVAGVGIVDGDQLNVSGRACSDGSGRFWNAVLLSSVTANTYNKIAWGNNAGAATDLALVLKLTGSAFDYMTQAEIDDVTSGAAPTVDVTAALQAFIDETDTNNDKTTGTFPDARYLIDSILFNSNGGVYIFENARFFAGATVATDYLVKYTGHDTFFRGTMTIIGQYTDNYVCGLQWISPVTGTPSGAAAFDHVRIQGCKIAVLYGAINGDPVVTQGHSENHIKYIDIKNCERGIYHNGGILTIHGGTIDIRATGWATDFVAADSRVMIKYQGALIMQGVQINHIQSTDTVSFENMAGQLNVSGGNWEIAKTEFLLSGGDVVVSNIASDVSSQALVPFCELVTGTSGTLTLSNINWNKGVATDGSVQALIETNTTPDWDVKISNVRVRYGNRNTLINSTYQDNTWVTKIRMTNVSVSATAGDLDISTSPYNLLDSVPVDTAAIDNMWFEFLASGAATTATNADVPTVAGRAYTTSIQVDASAGTASVTNMDRTSAVTARATGMRVTNGKKYICEGWVRREVAGTGNVKFFCLVYSAAGTLVSQLDISTEAQFVGTTWTYITGIVTVPTTGAFMGIGITVVNDIGYFVDLKVSRVD
jgi:hypothetical protein